MPTAYMPVRLYIRRLSVTRRYCVDMAAGVITQSTPRSR